MVDWVATWCKNNLPHMRCQNCNIMKVKGTEAKKQNQKQWSRFQSLLYQQVMGEVLSLLQQAVYWGAWIKCANETERWVYPFILGLIANNQEWYVTLSVPMLIGVTTHSQPLHTDIPHPCTDVSHAHRPFSNPWLSAQPPITCFSHACIYTRFSQGLIP